MGCGMMPMMYTGMQQYMPHMAMGMGMNMDMGMNRPPPPPFMPFPNMLASQRPLPPQTRMGGSHPPVHASDPPRVYGSNQQFDPNSSQAQYSAYMDPYQQFRSLHPSQPPQFQVLTFINGCSPAMNEINADMIFVFVLEESSSIVPKFKQGK